MPTQPQQPIQLYDFPLSGHAHRVELLLRMLQLPYNKVQVDLRQGQHKQPPHLALHPFGQVPVLDDNGTIIWDSAAILLYLARRYDQPDNFLPSDAVAEAQVQQWLSVAAGPLFNGPCTARRLMIFRQAGDVAPAQAIAHKLLAVMNTHLQTRSYLVAERLTIADLANYSYTAHAPEGGIDLSPYPQVQAWLQRIEATPGFVPMVVSKVGLWAE